jgi:hypothetical protein
MTTEQLGFVLQAVVVVGAAVVFIFALIRLVLARFNDALSTLISHNADLAARVADYISPEAIERIVAVMRGGVDIASAAAAITPITQDDRIVKMAKSELEAAQLEIERLKAQIAALEQVQQQTLG